MPRHMHGKIKRESYLFSCYHYRLIDAFSGIVTSFIQCIGIVKVKIVFDQVKNIATPDTFLTPFL